MADNFWRAVARVPPLACLGALAVVAFSGPGCVIPISNPSGGSTGESSDGGTGGGGGGGGTSGGGTSTGFPADASIPTGTWTNETANLANMPSECGTLTRLSAKPNEDFMIAGISLDGLWGSKNGATTWSALSTATGSAVITNRPSSFVYDPTTPSRFWESGLYNAGGVYVTNDDGVTFTVLGNSHHVDLVSVDFTDPNRQTIVAGGHEQSQTLNLSIDGGNTWTAIGTMLPPMTDCTWPIVIDSMHFLVGCAGFGGGFTGVYRTSDRGATWTEASTLGGDGLPLVASDGSIYWANGGGAGLARSTDQGMTWTTVAKTGGAYLGGHPIELPDGRIAAVGTDYIVASSDHGATWLPISAALPYSDVDGVEYSPQRKLLYVWQIVCGAPPVDVPANAVMTFPFDYTKQ